MGEPRECSASQTEALGCGCVYRTPTDLELVATWPTRSVAVENVQYVCYCTSTDLKLICHKVYLKYSSSTRFVGNLGEDCF